MLNYGGSITSSFPNTFCHSPASLTCQLCNTVIKEAGTGSFSFIYSQSAGQPFQIPNRSEKCIHCGINICEKCLNDNQELNAQHEQISIEERLSSHSSKNVSLNSSHQTQSQVHYNVVKKEFKQMYNYSKEIVEKLHLLNNAIKIEESAVGELNSIKHLVNTKAIELIKQINQEKIELVEQIENAKLKYESMLNDRKEYYALSMQYKDELRKVIRKYKEYKSDEQCNLSEMLKMYLSVKSITKNLDDYDHIKLITEQDPLQVKFEERPTYRNLIGKLLLNKESIEIINLDEQIKNSTENLSKEIIQVLNHQLKSASQNKIIDKKTTLKPKLNKSIENLNNLPLNQLLKNSKKESSRSVSLNDLLNMDENEPPTRNEPFNKNNQINMIKCGSDAKNTKRYSILKNDNQRNLISKSTNNLLPSNDDLKKKSSKNRNHQFGMLYKGPPVPPPPPQPQQSVTNNQNLLIKQLPYLPFNTQSPLNINKQPQLQSILKNSDNSMQQQQTQLNNHLNEMINKRMESYKLKKMPKERLEIDIQPSYLSFSQNKLLIASQHGRIRVIDLFSYKIQKDELKSILINGICIPKHFNDSTTEMFYTVANAEMKNPRDDPLSVSNSVVIVTKNELRVLKKKDPNDNDNYLFANPSGVCYDDFGNLYICDTGNNRIKILDQNLLLRCTIETASNQNDYLSQPKSVTCFQNVLFVCDSAKNRIVSYYILYNGEEFRFKNIIGFNHGTDPLLRFPIDVSIDDLGIVGVRDFQSSGVQLFGIDSRPFHFIETNSERELVHSMTIGGNGDIYVAKMVNVQESDLSGQINTINKYFIDIY